MARTAPEGPALPVLPDRPAPRGRPRDLARGVRGFLLWVAPIALFTIASPLRLAGGIDALTQGELIVVGTTGFGLLCLANALRCGRVHCWIDGTVLLALAVAGVSNLLGVVSFGWDPFISAVWLVVIASFVLEWIVGPYVRIGPRPRRA